LERMLALALVARRRVRRGVIVSFMVDVVKKK
jgi:hypothetical protein